MAIPLSALRRALAEMAEGASVGARQAYGVPHVDQGIAWGGLPGAVGGGAVGAALDDDETYRTNGPGAGMIIGALGGAMLGGGAGGLAKLAHMAASGGGGGVAGLSRGLREALAEQAATRGMGRRAVREAADAEDAATFGAASARRETPLVEEMRSAGQRPFARMPDAMDEMQELQAASRILRRLKQERRVATDPEDVADLDQQIAELTRLLGG